ncbi:MAG: hypothetical protein ABJL54_18805 [Halioglobus sp.]
MGKSRESLKDAAQLGHVKFGGYGPDATEHFNVSNDATSILPEVYCSTTTLSTLYEGRKRTSHLEEITERIAENVAA